MGIPSYNIATSVNLVIAQRLLRRLCVHCRQPTSVDESILLEQGFTKEKIKNLILYTAVGCEHCHGGYSGRCAIFEVLPISTGIKDLIMKHGNSLDIEQKAQEEGMITLLQAGLNKIREGITSLDELNRVVG
jgi:type IV pilus assembly protein PilB